MFHRARDTRIYRGPRLIIKQSPRGGQDLRHGQKNAVNVYYLLVAESLIERRVMDTLAAKTPAVDGVLDNPDAESTFLEILKELARSRSRVRKTPRRMKLLRGHFPMITVTAAVQKYGIGRYTLFRLIHKGVIRCEKQGGTIWLLNEEDVEEYLSLVPLAKIAGKGPGRTRAHYHRSKLPNGDVRIIQGRYYLTSKGAKALESLLRGNE